MKNSVTFLLIISFLGIMPTAFADSDFEGQLEFAGSLEETLGHLWALELNLDEKNSELALVHATHPIAELYETMKNNLQENPEFDLKLQDTLMQLQHKANTEISREEAQIAINEAKEIIEEARTIVVDQDLNDDSNFKMQLIMGLLETSKIEYEEAVNDGVIKEMAEFQDGSAFVWRSQQIFNEIAGDLDATKSAKIDGLFANVWEEFEIKSDPEDFELMIDTLIAEFEELSGVDSKPSEHQEVILMDLPPLKQIKEGIEPQNVTCKSNLELIFKYSGIPACVNPSSIEKLVERGWRI